MQIHATAAAGRPLHRQQQEQQQSASAAVELDDLDADPPQQWSSSRIRRALEAPADEREEDASTSSGAARKAPTLRERQQGDELADDYWTQQQRQRLLGAVATPMSQVSHAAIMWRRRGTRYFAQAPEKQPTEVVESRSSSRRATTSQWQVTIDERTTSAASSSWQYDTSADSRGRPERVSTPGVDHKNAKINAGTLSRHDRMTKQCYASSIRFKPYNVRLQCRCKRS